MPNIAHILFGLVLTVPVMFIARDRMNYKAVLIYILNNYIGPDSSYPFRFLQFNGHRITGYILWAAVLAFMYSYISRFSISRKGWKFEIHDDGVIEVPYKEAYMLCLAGGLGHFFMDMIGHFSLTLNLADSFSYSLVDVQEWGQSYYHEVSIISAYGYIFVLIVMVFLFQILQKEPKKQIFFILIIMVSVVLSTLIFGGEVFAELELSMAFILFVYFLAPMFLYYQALANVNKFTTFRTENPDIIKTKKRLLSSKQIFTAVIITLSVLCAALFIAGPIVMSRADEISASLSYSRDLFYYGAWGAIGLGIILSLITLFVALKKEFARQCVIIIGFLGYIAVIPMVLAFALNESEIKQYFQKKKITNENYHVSN